MIRSHEEVDQTLNELRDEVNTLKEKVRNLEGFSNSKNQDQVDHYFGDLTSQMREKGIYKVLSKKNEP